MSNLRHEESALGYVLRGLIPYTDANLKLAFKPSVFFAELRQRSRVKEKSMQNAYYDARKKGLIEIDEFGIPRLTEQGRKRVNIFEPKNLPRGSKLMIIFDIPEHERWKRTRLRRLLRELSFVQVQKSVWKTKYDHTEYIRSEISHSGLTEYVHLYETFEIQ